jgi:hypothetical protein
MGIDKWSVTDCDYTEEIKKYLIKNYKNKQNTSCPKKFWESSQQFNNEYYSCNPIAFYPYLAKYSKNVIKYFEDNNVDFLIMGEVCKYDLLDNLYSDKFKKIIGQEYITDKQVNDKKIENLHKKFLKDFNLNENNVVSVQELKNNYHKLFATISNIYDVQNAYNIYTCNINTQHTDIKNNIEYYSLIKPEPLNIWCNDYFNFHSQIHITKAFIKDKIIIVINVHNRKFVKDNTHIFYKYFIELVDFFKTYMANIVIMGDFNFNVNPDNKKLFTEFSENLKTRGYAQYGLDNVYSLHKACSQNEKHVALGLFTNCQDFIVTFVSTMDCSLDLETSSHLPIVFNMIENIKQNIDQYINSIKYIMGTFYLRIFEIIGNSNMSDDMPQKIQECINLKDTNIKDIRPKFDSIKYTIIEVINLLNARLFSKIRSVLNKDLD